MPQASLDAPVTAYGDLAKWFLVAASDFETGDRKMIAHVRGRYLDLTPNYVAECRHKAHNLMAILEAFERARLVVRIEPPPKLA